MPIGIVKWFNVQKGVGDDNGEDVSIQILAVEQAESLGLNDE